MAISISTLFAGDVLAQNVQLFNADGSTANPTADQAWLAFVAPGTTPASGDWKVGTWETLTSGQYNLSINMQNSGLGTTYVAGTYVMWLKVIHGSRTPVLAVDTVTIS